MEEKEFYTPYHGGNVQAIADEFGVDADCLVDFSANINPLGPPAAVLERLRKDVTDVKLLMRYPEAKSTELRRRLALRHHVEENRIIVGGGASALIETIVRVVQRKASEPPCCLLPVPAFSEYERALRAADFRVSCFQLEKENDFHLHPQKFIEILQKSKPDLIIITNPHNPTGVLIKREKLEKIVRQAEKQRVFVLLDEAFIDYAPEESLASTAKFNNLVVLRSLTKFYAMPALRVGYAVVPKNLAGVFDEQIPSWSVTTLASNAATAALEERDYERQTLKNNNAERKYLKESLTKIGLKVFPSAANFLLVELPSKFSAAELSLELIRKNRLIVRNCSTYSGIESDRFVRLAVLKHSENKRLVAAIDNFIN